MKISKNLPQNISETVTYENDKEIPKKDIYSQNDNKKILMI